MPILKVFRRSSNQLLTLALKVRKIINCRVKSNFKTIQTQMDRKLRRIKLKKRNLFRKMFRS